MRPPLFRVVMCQAKDANPLQKLLANKVGNYQLLEDEAGPGALQNVVELAPFLKVRAGAACEADAAASALDRTTVNINYARVELFNIRRALHDKHCACVWLGKCVFPASCHALRQHKECANSGRSTSFAAMQQLEEFENQWGALAAQDTAAFQQCSAWVYRVALP